MKYQRSIFSFGLALTLFAGPAGISRAQSALTADGVLRRSLARAQADQQGSGPDFKYRKLTATEELDGSGKVKERREKVYEISYRDGLSYATLLQVNGHLPNESDLKQQADNEMNINKLLGQAKPVKGDNRENFLTPELVARFDFKLVGLSNLNGRATYELSFAPRNPPPQVHRMVDRLLNQLSGTIWIDAQEFEVARAEVSLRSQVDFFGGLIGSLKRLTYTLERTRLANGVWFSTLSSGDFQGRKLLDSTHVKTRSQSVNFRRLSMAGDFYG